MYDFNNMYDFNINVYVLRSNIADKADKALAPNEADIQNLSDTCDGLMSFKMDTLATLDNFQSKLNNLSDQVEVLLKALDDALLYSYQYDLKIVGVPQTSYRETAKETAEVCIKIFKKIGVKVSLADIDIAHRVQPRSQNGRRKKGNPIICKFVRRMVRDEELDARSRTDRLTASDFSDYEMDRIGIFSHLTPRLQELLRKAKTHQTSFQYKFCWAKGTAIFLRKTEISRIILINYESDPEDLRNSDGSQDR